MRSEASWSWLSDKPTIVYDKHWDAMLCYWNGVGMTRTYGLIIAGVTFAGLYPSTSQRDYAWCEYEKLYLSGAFKTRGWDSILEWTDHHTMHNRLIRMMTDNNGEFFQSLVSKYTPQEAFSWFTADKAIKVET